MKKYIAGALFAIIIPSISFGQSTAQVEKNIYQLDMFSLISFALAITALLLSFFMSWLSWEFYKKSTDAADRTNQTVIRIEAIVDGVQSSISEIVQKAVWYWIESGDGDSDVDQSKREVDDRIERLEKTIMQGSSENNHDLLSELSEVKRQIDELGRGIKESKIKTIFPNLNRDNPTVTYSQENSHIDDAEQRGILRVKIIRPTRVATATVKFNPHFMAAPSIQTTLVQSPYEDTSTITSKPGTPSNKLCNIHLNCKDLLQVGEYTFEFIATLPR